MGDLVIAQIDRALGCLSKHDVHGTRVIIERDISVNRMDIDLEEICMQLLALHQPVAGDLRLITAAMKITTELERIGDRVVNICEAVHNRDERDPVTSHAEVSQMGTLAVAMVRDSLTAFAEWTVRSPNGCLRRTTSLMRSMARCSRSSLRWQKNEAAGLEPWVSVPSGWFVGWWRNSGHRWRPSLATRLIGKTYRQTLSSRFVTTTGIEIAHRFDPFLI